MIVQRTYTLNGQSITVTKSDEGRYVVRDGVSYEVAEDPTDLGRTYTEGELMEDPEAEEALNILLGGDAV